MRKSLKFFIALTTILSSAVNIVACDITPYYPQPDPQPPIPDPGKKTIDDYQHDIDNSLQQIASLNEDLNHINEIKDQDWRNYMLFNLKGEINLYNSKINDDNYQILLLENNNILNPETKKTAKKILNFELDNLKNEILNLSNPALHGDALQAVNVAKAQEALVIQEINNL